MQARCRLEGEDLAETVTLRTETGVALGVLRSAQHVRVDLAEGRGEIRAWAWPLRLGAAVRANDLSVFLQVAVTVGGLVVPGPDEPLSVVHVRGDHVTLRASVPPALEGDLERDVDLRCSVAALSPLAPELRAPPPSGTKQLELVGGAVPIARDPALVPDASLRLRDTDESIVSVLDQRGDVARIRWWDGRRAVVGWVPRAALTPANARLPAREAEPPDTVQKVASPGERLTCARDVPLIAARGDERWTLGAVRAGGEIVPRDGPAPAGLVVVDVVTGAAAPAPGVQWLVRSHDLRACRASREIR